MTATDFIKILKRRRGVLTAHQIKTLKGQALAGDAEGARKGLYKILNGSGRNEI